MATPRSSCLAGALLALVGCQRAAPPPRRVVARVLSQTVEPQAGAAPTLRGQLVANSRMRLGFKLGGVIRAVKVHIGDRVRAGQLLATLDTVDATARLQLALVACAKAKRDLERTGRLSDLGAATTNAHEDARTAYELALANVALARDALHHARLLAPAAGTVFRRLAEPGEAVSPGAPVLLVDQSEQQLVRVGVTGRDLPRVPVGERVTGTLEDGRRCALRVRGVASTPEAADGLYTVELTPVDRTLAGLPSGALVDVTLAERGAPVVRVPLAALVHRQDRDWAFVIEYVGRTPVARARALQLGDVDGNAVEVREGLLRGERIVAEGGYFLRDGQRVELAD